MNLLIRTNIKEYGLGNPGVTVLYSNICDTGRTHDMALKVGPGCWNWWFIRGSCLQNWRDFWLRYFSEVLGSKIIGHVTMFPRPVCGILICCNGMALIKAITKEYVFSLQGWSARTSGPQSSSKTQSEPWCWDYVLRDPSLHWPKYRSSWICFLAISSAKWSGISTETWVLPVFFPMCLAKFEWVSLL